MIPLHIETHDRHLGFDMAESSSLKSGLIINAPGGVALTYQGSLVRKSVGIPEVLQFVIDVSTNIDVGLFGAWLYDKVKGKSVERIIINRCVVTEITEHGVRQALEEEIRSGESVPNYRFRLTVRASRPSLISSTLRGRQRRTD